MTIELLIKTFKQCIRLYQKASDEDYTYEKLTLYSLEKGICFLCSKVFRSHGMYCLFSNDGFYKNFMEDNNYLFKMPYLSIKCYNKDDMIKDCIDTRLQFLKEQVIYLQSLQKKGYTHV